MEIILASASPRRREILSNAGITFRVVTADIDETIDKATVQEAVMDIADRKAAAVAQKESGVVIAADTVVALEGKIMGKPADDEEAVAMLKSLSGRMHEVYTGVCVRCGENVHRFFERTKVYFRIMDDESIRRYVRTGEPRDKAGAYAIQGRGAVMITHIEGDYLNVVGLPLSHLCEVLERNGYINELF